MFRSVLSKSVRRKGPPLRLQLTGRILETNSWLIWRLKFIHAQVFHRLRKTLPSQPELGICTMGKFVNNVFFIALTISESQRTFWRWGG